MFSSSWSSEGNQSLSMGTVCLWEPGGLQSTDSSRKITSSGLFASDTSSYSDASSRPSHYPVMTTRSSSASSDF